MAVRYGAVLGTLLATVVLQAEAGGVAIGAGFRGFYGVPYAYGVPFGYGLYDPWFSCLPPYFCRDPWQLRVELERERRMQELRELATPSAPRAYGLGDGPWGWQRYIPPPTPEANIQPAYRGVSQLRPEYEQSAQPSATPAPDAPN